MVLAFARLSGRVQSNLGIIRGGISRGLSSFEINNLIRGTGQLGIRRTDLLSGIRHIQGIAESANRIRSVTLDRFPDPMRIEVGKGPMISNFSYDVRVRGRVLQTGDIVDRFVTIRSDRNLTPRQILEETERALDAAPEEAAYNLVREDRQLTLVGARRRA